MDRRKAIAGLSSMLLLPKGANALQLCPANDLPPGTCSAMLDPGRFRGFAVPSLQRNSQWCWAACIEMVCRWYGISISQQSIVAQVYGGVQNMPADDGTLTKALNSNWTADDGSHFKISSFVFSPALHRSDVSNDRVIDDLTNDYPLINGSRSHATVVARVDYQRTPDGTPLVGRVHVIDPWPGAAGPPYFARFLAPDEMRPASLPGGSLRYLASIRIS